MDAEIKRKWVEALRSGKLKQGTGNLYADRAYCCLGVLIKVQGGVISKKRLVIDGEDPRRKVAEDQEEYLRENFSCGLSYATQEHLARLNDGSKNGNIPQHTFVQIADYIEQNL